VREYIEHAARDYCVECKHQGYLLCHCRRDKTGRRLAQPEGIPIIDRHQLTTKTTINWTRYHQKRLWFHHAYGINPWFDSEIDLDEVIDHLTLKGDIVIETSLSR